MPDSAARAPACITRALVAACCGLLALATAAAQPAAAQRPNIVVLVADDWGFTDVGAYGSEIATPHIDALAQRGVRFSNFHVAASCSPTRAMLLTGVDNHRNGVGNLREAMPRSHLGQPGYQGSLTRNVVTVASLLQDGGYRTYASGKWNVGSEPYNRPNRRGFDRSIVQGDTGSDNWEPAKRYLPHSAGVEWFEDGEPVQMPTTFYSSQYFVDRAIEYIDSGAASGKPFFAYVAFQANHVPVQAPQAFIDKYRGRYDAGWDVLRRERRDQAAAHGLVPRDAPYTTMTTSARWNTLAAKDRQYQARQMEVYAAMAEAMDHHVGRLVAHLRTTGQYDNTVFLFLSDNGPEGSDYAQAQPWLWTQYSQHIDRLGGKGAYGIPGPGWASATAAPLDTYKFYAGEGGLRVPLIIAGVPGVAANQVQPSLTHVNDIVPTVLDLAGLQHPGTRYRGQAIEPLTGRSLLPVLTGQADAVHPADVPIGYELSGNAALFKGRHKLVRNLPPVGDGAWHLYDLDTDPGETQDLRDRLPEVFASMQRDYAAYAQANGVLPMPAGYDPTWQVTINSLHNYWIPAYRTHALVVLAAAVAALAWWWRRRRRARPPR
ncbi:arylsulfatase [Comamonadaceae bacterium G21597-S1]|nr:arylsulfatase [Comamonadaceae bacterium G21597-S1]